MDAPGTVPDTINCHQCGTVLDLTDQIAFSHIECPQCNALSVVPLHFANFLLLSPIGIGGMGTVYKAIDLSLNRFLALKILRPKLAATPQFIENFSREARAAAASGHPNIAQVYSFGDTDGHYYLAMELLERGSLDDRMTNFGKLPEKDVLEMGMHIAAGLRAAYQRGLLHRDVKPGNILFSDEGLPKLVDFGLARPQAQSLVPGQAPEPIWGTPYYIAPEKLLGQQEDFRSDIYSLGASMFHALAGRPPFEAATAGEVVAKHATQPVFSLKTYAPTTHDRTAHVIGRMLAKNPADRHASYDELIHDLEQALAELKAADAQKTVVAASGERIPVTSIITTVLALVICAIAAVLFYLKFLRDTPSPVAPSPVASSGSTNTAPPVTTTNPTTNEIDFSSAEPWVSAWTVATQQAALGKYNDALLNYDHARPLLQTQPKHWQWILFYEGLTLLAADHQAQAWSIFLKAWDIDPTAKPQIPDPVTTRNFIDPLVQAMAVTFWFDADAEPKGRRVWAQMNMNTWLERPASGNSVFYNVLEHTVLDGVPGTIVRRAPDGGLDVFIPDIGSRSQAVKMRIGQAGDWLPLGEMQNPLTELLTASGRLPPWAAGMTELCVGFKLRELGQFQTATDAFRQYTKHEHPESQNWAFALKDLADRLAADCEAAAATVAGIEALEKQQKFSAALDELRAASAKATLPSLKAILQAREPQLQHAIETQKMSDEEARAAAERIKMQQNERTRVRAAAEVKQLLAADPEVLPLYQTYDFTAGVTHYEPFATRLQTEGGKTALEARLTAGRLLAEFKKQLADDFARHPYDRGDLMTRTGKLLADRLAKATDGQLVFKTKYGDVLVDWRDMPPAALARIGEYYITTFAPSDKPEAIARRYLQLAVFARQFGLDRAAAYAQQATQLAPDLQKTVLLIFGKPAADEKPDAAPAP